MKKNIKENYLGLSFFNQLKIYDKFLETLQTKKNKKVLRYLNETFENYFNFKINLHEAMNNVTYLNKNELEELKNDLLEQIREYESYDDENKDSFRESILFFIEISVTWFSITTLIPAIKPGSSLFSNSTMQLCFLFKASLIFVKSLSSSGRTEYTIAFLIPKSSFIFLTYFLYCNISIHSMHCFFTLKALDAICISCYNTIKCYFFNTI